MSEKLNIHETLPESQNETVTKIVQPEKPAEIKNEAREQAEEARKAIAETKTRPDPLEKLKKVEKAPKPAPNTDVNRELKQVTLRRELKNIRRKLPAPQRALSKVIHQPVVRVTSEAVGKTASRPSGLLGGGIVALMGTTAYLYLANHIGFEYNYGVFLALFAGGFLLGLLIEFLVFAATSSRRKANS